MAALVAGFPLVHVVITAGHPGVAVACLFEIFGELHRLCRLVDQSLRDDLFYRCVFWFYDIE